MSRDDSGGSMDPWAKLRFSIVGSLLASPPSPRELNRELEALAAKSWRHPFRDELVSFSKASIERWYYRALNSDNPIEALRRKVRSDAGQIRVFSPELLRALESQYRSFSSWSYQLHADNLEALIGEHPDWGPSPSYQSVRRVMQRYGWYKKPLKRRKLTDGERRALERLEQFEVRSFEASHVHGLWHLDFHQASLRVVDREGRCFTPWLLGILDDRSRVCCHVQWYDVESSETLFHGLVQAFAKWGLSRQLMTDNGGAMLAGETLSGLESLSIIHRTTLTRSPYQKGSTSYCTSSVICVANSLQAM